MRKLLIISGSPRVLRNPVQPIPAIQRFDGIITRTVKKYYEQISNIDVLIVSPVYGLIKAEEKISFKEPACGNWHKLKLSKEHVSYLKERNLSILQNLLQRRKYDEIYVNVGKNLLKIIEGFDKVVPRSTKITYAEGSGIGPKMAHMKKWIEVNIQAI